MQANMRGPTLAGTAIMVVHLLFAVALIVGYFRPALILAVFPILLLVSGYWAFGPLLLGIFVIVRRSG